MPGSVLGPKDKEMTKPGNVLVLEELLQGQQEPIALK